MKLLSAFYEGNEIAIHKISEDTVAIYYNDEELSIKQNRFMGTVHRFTVDEAGEAANYKITVSAGKRFLNAYVFRNNKYLLQCTYHIPSSKRKEDFSESKQSDFV